MRLLLVGALAALAGAIPTVYHRKPSDALEKRLEQQETTLDRALAKIDELAMKVDEAAEEHGHYALPALQKSGALERSWFEACKDYNDDCETCVTVDSSLLGVAGGKCSYWRTPYGSTRCSHRNRAGGGSLPEGSKMIAAHGQRWRCECEVIIMSVTPLEGLDWTLMKGDAIPSKIREYFETVGLSQWLSERFLYKAPTIPQAQELYNRYGPFENTLPGEFDRLLTSAEKEYVSQAQRAGNLCDFDPTGKWMGTSFGEQWLESGAGFVSEGIGDHRIMMGLVPKKPENDEEAEKKKAAAEAEAQAKAEAHMNALKEEEELIYKRKMQEEKDLAYAQRLQEEEAAAAAAEAAAAAAAAKEAAAEAAAAAKKKPAAPAKAADEDALRKLAALEVLDTRGDGNCGYHAVLQMICEAKAMAGEDLGLPLGRPPPHPAETFRQALQNRLKGNVKFPREDVNWLREELVNTIHDDESRRRIRGGIHMNQVRGCNYMEEEELLAIIKLFGLCIEVFKDHRGRVEKVIDASGANIGIPTSPPRTPDDPHYVCPYKSYLQNTGVHFELLVPKHDPELPNLLAALHEAEAAQADRILASNNVGVRNDANDEDLRGAPASDKLAFLSNALPAIDVDVLREALELAGGQAEVVIDRFAAP